ncbi:hypothetical protein BT96DRAFT_810258, partial [Gymnopus androsaceus JB14]
MDWSEVDPKDRLAGIIAVALASTKPLVVMGDLNGRTGSWVTCNGSPVRSSSDPKTNSRGSWIRDLCKENRLDIINGTSYESSSPGKLTSFQLNGSSVINYVLVSTSALPLLRDGCLSIVKSQLSDHASLQLTLPFT